MDILFRISRWLWFLCSWMPLRVHYIFSDVVFFPLIYYVLRYRRALVKQQLRDSFPDFGRSNATSTAGFRTTWWKR